MAEVQELTDAQKAFIQPFLPTEAPSSRPFVTLTYACSLDSMISLAPGVRTTLSGPETKSMTHYLRLHHDSILVGVGTAVADDPSLNCRYPGAELESQPRPVVIDPTFRWKVEDSKVAQLALEKKGKTVWTIYPPKTIKELRQAAGCERVCVDLNGLVDIGGAPLAGFPDRAPQRLTWTSILKALKEKAVNSVMIEGGATVINQLLSRPALVDSVIITVAPTFLGKGGTQVSPEKAVDGGGVNAAYIKHPTWQQFGQDVVLCGKLSG